MRKELRAIWVASAIASLGGCGHGALQPARDGGRDSAVDASQAIRARDASASGREIAASSTGGHPAPTNASTGGSSAHAGNAGTIGASGTGTGGRTAHASGGAGGDASGSSASPIACAAPNVCDDFESYTQGGGFGPWKQQGSSGTLTVDSAHTFSGKQAVHFQINAGANQRVQLEQKGAPLFPAPSNAFWGRVMIFASQLPGMSDTENKDVHYDVIQASGSDPGEYRIAGMGNVLLNYEPHDCYFNTQKTIPEDRWACWEWLYDGANDVIEFYIDGALQARVQSKGQGCVDGTDSVWAAPTFDSLRIGFVNYQSKPAVTELWIDDFAAGANRIGCPDAPSSAH